MDVKKIDLNALVVLVTLLKEKSMTKAAESLGVSQPSVSYTIKKLRTQLNDELFIYNNKELIPTNRALELYEPISSAIAIINRSMKQGGDLFNYTAGMEFVMACSSCFEETYFSAIAINLCYSAPNAKVRAIELLTTSNNKLVASNRDSILGLLDSGRVQVIVDHIIDPYLSLKSRHIIEDELVVVTPGPSHFNSLDEIISESNYKYLQCIPDSYLPQAIVEAVGPSVISTSSIGSALLTVSHSDTFTLVPKRSFLMSPFVDDLSWVRPSVECVGFSTYVLWHCRDDNNPEVTWLKTAIGNICS